MISIQIERPDKHPIIAGNPFLVYLVGDIPGPTWNEKEGQIVKIMTGIKIDLPTNMRLIAVSEQEGFDILSITMTKEREIKLVAITDFWLSRYNEKPIASIRIIEQKTSNIRFIERTPQGRMIAGGAKKIENSNKI